VPKSARMKTRKLGPDATAYQVDGDEIEMYLPCYLCLKGSKSIVSIGQSKRLRCVTQTICRECHRKIGELF